VSAMYGVEAAAEKADVHPVFPARFFPPDPYYLIFATTPR